MSFYRVRMFPPVEMIDAGGSPGSQENSAPIVETYL